MSVCVSSCSSSGRIVCDKQSHHGMERFSSSTDTIQPAVRKSRSSSKYCRRTHCFGHHARLSNLTRISSATHARPATARLARSIARASNRTTCDMLHVQAACETATACGSKDVATRVAVIDARTKTNPASWFVTGCFSSFT